MRRLLSGNPGHLKTEMITAAVEIRMGAGTAKALPIRLEAPSGGTNKGEPAQMAWAVDFLNRLPNDLTVAGAILCYHWPCGVKQKDPDPTKDERRAFWRDVRGSGLWKEGLGVLTALAKREDKERKTFDSL